jgi:hypothetical protein
MGATTSSIATLNITTLSIDYRYAQCRSSVQNDLS